MNELPVFQKYSQSGEEGYLEHLLNQLPRENWIVELGAGDGIHISNTRYFIEKGYNAILIDKDNRGNDDVKQHFIIRENIVPLLKTYKCPEKFDFLSIDIDGNDYWIIDEILQHYKPNVVIAEINAFIPNNVALTVKYDPDLEWKGDTYFGFNLKAGMKLAEKYGYTIVFQNDSMNIYMVRNEYVSEKPEITCEHKVFFEISRRTDWVEV